MAAVAVALLAIGVLGAVSRPFGLAAWVLPLGAAAFDLALGAVSGHELGVAIVSLAPPIAFLLAAVPLAVLTDRLGFFGAAAALLTRGGDGSGGLWVLAAVVTTVLNLDASVVLLTPLYVSLARRRRVDPLGLALMPLVLSWLASSALPVSNLTNLIAMARTGAGAADFIAHLGLPSVVAVAVGWGCYRRRVRTRSPPGVPLGPGIVAPSLGARGGQGPLDPAERRALALGGAVIGLVLVGFVLGPGFGIEAWEVALGADVILAAALRKAPWRSVPLGTGLIAASLGVLAIAAVSDLPIGALLGSSTSTVGLARVVGVTALAANLVNNLPALLVVAPSFGSRPGPTMWAALLGVNMGPVLLATGTLASLLWLDTLRRLDVTVRSWDVSAAGLEIGLPAALAGAATLLGLHAAGFVS